ncbi:hypothetical protein HYALB_00002515 [Hymenoscyphus albidus]|uniref:Uncharacterized protein n=1 Tax=Hymenoscyphus albidus TaxID=595503 RepID=A0A9N9PZI5_9HELO|nr:hypothetical protein HYALB_00002515 [Hymenoscyphus albidus]
MPFSRHPSQHSRESSRNPRDSYIRSSPSIQNSPPPTQYPTNSSLYSLSHLSARNPHRYLHASSVRRQVASAPSEPLQSTQSQSTRSRYPKPFRNNENLPLQEPWRSHEEYPIVYEHGENYTDADGQAPGPVRAVYHHGDRSKVDVVYHDVKISRNMSINMRFAEYRASRR